MQCSGRSELLKIAQRAPRAAQNRSERSQSRSEPLRAVRGTALGRPEPLRVAQSDRSGSPRARPELLRLKSRSEKCSGRSELLKIALSAHRVAQNRLESLRARPEPLRAAQSRSEPPRAFAQSCSRNCSGSPRAAQNRQERSLKVAQSRSESLRARPKLLRAAQSCSRKRSGSQGHPERAQSCSV